MSNLEIERLDRLEKKQQELVEDLAIVGENIRDIKNAIVGNELNNNHGMLFKINEIEDRVEDLETFKNEVSVYVNQFKVVIVIILGSLATILIKIFSKP
jgi:fructose-1,6-bisphosphatase